MKDIRGKVNKYGDEGHADGWHDVMKRTETKMKISDVKKKKVKR